MDSIAGWKQYKLHSGSYVKENCYWLASNSAVPALFRLQEEKAVLCREKKIGTAGFEARNYYNYNKNMKQHVRMESQSSGSNLLKLKLETLNPQASLIN